MYLEHFGLNNPPFKITPATDFFFSGANRGEILDALIYAITESEGIIKVTGEVGSGKTMLCRMLLERLPPHIETVYLANPSLSREEMLYAIADGLGLDLEGQRVNVIMQALQNLLAKKNEQGKRVVVLVDEAHAMPLDTLEELRLLYNLQLGDRKLLQIMLFGQPELNYKLSQPNMRQLKDRIVHHFNMLPLSKSVVIAYLLFRMRAAGYRGPNVFSVDAVNMISAASNGLMRRVNILADKALLAAFIENTHDIEVRHVQAAILDSELSLPPWYRRKAVVAGAAALLILLSAGAFWLFNGSNPDAPVAETRPAASPQSSAAVNAPPPPPAPAALPAPAAVPAPAALPAPAAPSAPPMTDSPLPALLAQRLAATRDMLARQNHNGASIQLFYTTEARTERLEDFLLRAKRLGKLDEIFVLSGKINGKEGYRVLYGSYPDLATAREGMQQLPQRYKNGFSSVPYLIPAAQAAS